MRRQTVGTMVAVVSAYRTTWAPLRRWKVTLGASSMTCLAVDYFAARDKAASMGFRDPDSIVLVQEA